MAVVPSKAMRNRVLLVVLAVTPIVLVLVWLLWPGALQEGAIEVRTVPELSRVTTRPGVPENGAAAQVPNGATTAPERAAPPEGRPSPAAMTADPAGTTSPGTGTDARGAQLIAAARPGAPDAGRYRLDRDGIQAAVRSGLPEMKDCYEEWLKVQPSLGGRVVVRFTIDTDDAVEGRVSRAQVMADAGLGHVAMEGCVLSVMSALRFEPPLSGTMDVTYPLNFATDGG